VASAVLQILIRALRRALCRASPGAPPDARLGAISFPQRFGSSLNPHFHFHVLAVDGVFSEDQQTGEVRFHEATVLTPEDWHTLARDLQRRVLRAFRKRGLLGADAAADMLTWRANGGFSVDASVRIEGADRAGLERLVRYCARPPLALERLHAPAGIASLESPEAKLIYRLPEPDLQGRTALALTPLSLLARLSRLLPPPRIHRQRYHGVLAPNARLRARVVAIGREAADEEQGVEDGSGPLDSPKPESPPDGAQPVVPRGAPSPPHPADRPERPRASRSRALWALLLARIYEVLPLLCPACGGEMRILAFLTDPPTVRAILLHLELPHRPPPLTPARGPPQSELAFDQSPAFDLSDPEPVPDLDFDQSVPDWPEPEE
jgi:hypothetical protein